MTEIKQPDNNNVALDAALISMIEPKVREIQQKFNQGEKLTQDDTNTLLLRAQYNHINHLDLRLDEVTASVVDLNGEFKITELKFDKLELKFESLKSNMDLKFDKMEIKFESLKSDMDAKFDKMDLKFESLKSDINTKFELLEEKIGHTIQKALNKNMMALITVMGAFLVLSKVFDRFLS